MFITQTPPIRTGALTYMLLCVSDAWSTNIAIAMFVYTFAKLSKNCLHILYYMYICTCTYTYPKALRLVTPCIFVHVYVTLSTSAAMANY